MKKLLPFVFFVLILFSISTFAQITNLTVNDSTSHFTMESGSMIMWSYDLPVGDTASLEIWVDVNSNRVLDESDVLWQAFYQIDGRQDIEGPPDMDGTVNGHISFGAPVGLAPADYLMIFKNKGTTSTIPGTVTPLNNPVFSISGKITPPAGKSAQYLIVSIENSSKDGGKFWNAITDADGNYNIQMDNDTTGNPWKIRVDNASKFGSAIQTPDRIYLTLDAGVKTNYDNNNFTFTASAAQVNGIVTDGDNNPISGFDVYIQANNGSFTRNGRTSLDGSFSIGLISSELPLSNVWLGAGNPEDNSYLAAYSIISNIADGNTITRNLKVYAANSTITGRVLLNGNPPNVSITIEARVIDTCMIRTFTDLNGYYTLHVTDQRWNYKVLPIQLPPNYNPYEITAHPGQTNVDFNFTISGVKEDKQQLPKEFALMQNYPNPFNPTTKITWQLPVSGYITLKVYNLLGTEVATLVDEYKPAGTYESEFNASSLPSGIYFYRLQSGSFVQTKKMTLLR